MVRLSILLLIVAAAGIGLAYRHFVTRPERKLRDQQRGKRTGRAATGEGTSSAGH
jgi:hypothetical protein